MKQDFSRTVVKILLLGSLQGVLAQPTWSATDYLEPSSAPPHRIVSIPTLSVSPNTVHTSNGTQVKLTAQPAGGEAMLFSVDWSVREGAPGGRIETGSRTNSGAYEATYFAPDSGSGPFHIDVKLHEYPSAKAEVRIDLDTTLK